jgi:Leucine-rich repeat (LRR) protein
MFADCLSMKYFDLSNNNLTFIADNMFEYANQVKHLNLSHNQIDDIDSAAFEGMPKLRNLDLAGNKLASDSFLWPIVGLTHLNLSHNAYRTLNTSLMDHPEVVELAGNRWDCQWLMAELMVAPRRLNFGQEYLVEAKQKEFNVPGVACWEEGDVQKFIIVMDRSQVMDDVEVTLLLFQHIPNKVIDLLFPENPRQHHESQQQSLQSLCQLRTRIQRQLRCKNHPSLADHWHRRGVWCSDRHASVTQKVGKEERRPSVGTASKPEAKNATASTLHVSSVFVCQSRH